MKLDKLTRDAIASAVRDAVKEAQEVYGEQWVTCGQLCEQLPMFTAEWMKRYGHVLPRECARVTDVDGVEHRTKWVYPKKKILRMISEGKLRDLTVAAQPQHTEHGNVGGIAASYT